MNHKRWLGQIALGQIALRQLVGGLAAVLLLLTITSCGKSTPEELTQNLVSPPNGFLLSLEDPLFILQSSLQTCATQEGNGALPMFPQSAAVLDPESYGIPDIRVFFHPTSYSVVTEGVTSETGNWRAVDEDTIELSSQGTTAWFDVRMQGETLHVTPNAESFIVDCSELPTDASISSLPEASNPAPSVFVSEEGKPAPAAHEGGGSVSGSNPEAEVNPSESIPPPPPLSQTAQALQGTWCYYTGSPYYLGVILKEESFSVAYYYDNANGTTVNSSFKLRGVAGSIDDKTGSAQISLIDDPAVNTKGLNNPSPLLFNGTTKNYLKIKYGTNRTGFFKKSDSAGSCPGQTVSSGSLPLLP